MRESNFCNPAQNKASVCISSAVYDRRAIDCTATLPLINSLNHLAYLTSTSPRIREMVTLDGGLERLIRILRTVPKSPSPQVRAFSIKEMQAVWKWSLAFQCVVNIGVRGSESVRTRVVEAGMVPVTIRVLESYLRSMDRLKEERRKEALLHHQRHEARREDRSHRDRLEPSTSHAHLATLEGDDRARWQHHTTREDLVQAPHQADATYTAAASVDPLQSTHFAAVQPTRNGSIPPNAHDRLLTETRPTTPLEDPISARRSSVFADMEAQSSVDDYLPPQASPIPVVDADESHATMPIIDAIAINSSGGAPSAASDGTPRALASAQARDSDLAEVSSLEDLRSHAAEASGSGSEGPEDAEMFADDADDSEVDAIPSSTTRSVDSDHMSGSGQVEIDADDDNVEERRTPRPARRALAPLSGPDSPPRAAQTFFTPNRPTNAVAPPLFERQDTVRPSRNLPTTSTSRHAASTNLASTALAAQIGSHNEPNDRSSLFDRHLSREQPHAQVRAQPGASHSRQDHQLQHHHHHHQHHHRHTRDDASQSHSAHSAGRDGEPQQPQQRSVAPRDEARTAEARTTLPATEAAVAHPAVVQLSNLADTNARAGIDVVYREEEVLLSLQLLAYLSKYAHVRILFHSSDFTGASLMGPLDALNEELEQATKRNKSWDPSEPPRRNVFSLAEKFTLRSSRSNSAAYPAPRLSMEIQYWAGVIMRNACRKDESRGGIRQCANMLCGKWEEYPREFAKCRRCRKAKYCSKQCQSKGWQMGHRYWCSAKADEGEAKDKEREKANDPHRIGRNEDGGAGPQIVPLNNHNDENAGFAAALANAAGQGLGNADGPRLRLNGDVGLDGVDDNGINARRWQAGEAARDTQARDARARSHSRQDIDLPSSENASVRGARLQPVDLGSALPSTSDSGDAAMDGTYTGADGRQDGPSEMHRLTSSASSSVDMIVEPRHAVSASEDDEAWIGGASGPQAPRLGMMPSPFTDTNGDAGPSASSAWYAAGPVDGVERRHDAAHAFSSNTSSPLRDTTTDGGSQAPRGARRGVLPGSLGLPSTMLRQDLRDRRVTSLASLDTVDGSDASDDETERRLAQTQGILPAFAAAAAAAGLRAREGEAPPQPPQRTDLAGRPLPPPVIASQNGEEDELALGGRATPGVAGEQDFATGEIDQMLGHWATRRPGGIGLQHRLAEVRADLPSPERSLSPEAGSYGNTAEASEVAMGARSDDEDLGSASRAARYGGLYGQAPFHAGIVRGQTPQPHHRLHQQRSASGFSQYGTHGTRFGYGESMGEPSTLQAYHPSMVSSPLAQTPVRRTSGQDDGDASTNVVHGLEQAAHTLRQIHQRPVSSSGIVYGSEDVAMMHDAGSEQGAGESMHDRPAAPEDEVLEDADDRDDISMDL